MADRLVYSSGSGVLCTACGKPVSSCACRKAAARPKGDGIVRVRREVAGRRGKGVTTIEGVPLDDAALATLAATFKKRLGTGGSCKDGVIEIQGDHRDFIVTELQKLGYPVKRAGG